MGLNQKAFAEELKKYAKAGLDSSILIYHLEDMDPYSDLTEAIFSSIAEGSLHAVISTICITELLVRPFAKGQTDRVMALEQFLFAMPNMTLAPPNYAIAKEAARLRAVYKMRTPDALLASTALIEKTEVFLTNDRRLAGLRPEGLAILILDDYL
jgi:predicted nucleic acid-binding protein